MTRLLAAALLCALFATPAEAEHLRKSTCIETGALMTPLCGTPGSSSGIWQTSNDRRVTSIRVTMHRERRPKEITHKANRPDKSAAASKEISSFGIQSPDVGYSIARPARYIAGRLICAVNVGAALAERGIKGTGSALARSYDGWGFRVAQPVPGAVAVGHRQTRGRPCGHRLSS
jgi:hypothetical protein